MPTYNAALDRPAYQSSIWVSSGPSLAVDGDRDVSPENCMSTRRQSHPWWAVDLGRLTTVLRVDLFNRNNSYGTIFLASCAVLLH